MNRCKWFAIHGCRTISLDIIDNCEMGYKFVIDFIEMNFDNLSLLTSVTYLHCTFDSNRRQIQFFALESKESNGFCGGHTLATFAEDFEKVNKMWSFSFQLFKALKIEYLEMVNIMAIEQLFRSKSNQAWNINWKIFSNVRTIGRAQHWTYPA